MLQWPWTPTVWFNPEISDSAVGHVTTRDVQALFVFVITRRNAAEWRQTWGRDTWLYNLGCRGKLCILSLSFPQITSAANWHCFCNRLTFTFLIINAATYNHGNNGHFPDEPKLGGCLVDCKWSSLQNFLWHECPVSCPSWLQWPKRIT